MAETTDPAAPAADAPRRIRSSEATLAKLALNPRTVIDFTPEETAALEQFLGWSTTRSLLGDDLLARALCISPTSLRSYAAREEATPADVAERLQLVTRVLASLSGSYSPSGVGLWFERPRQQLGGAAPIELFERASGSVEIERVVALADELLGAASAS
jgi:hypothetical protein